jgi:hypothetical protein
MERFIEILTEWYPTILIVAGLAAGIFVAIAKKTKSTKDDVIAAKIAASIEQAKDLLNVEDEDGK